MVEESQLVSVRYARRTLEDADDASTDGLPEVVGINRGNDVEDLDLRDEARMGERHLERPFRATTCTGLSGRKEECQAQEDGDHTNHDARIASEASEMSEHGSSREAGG